MVNKNEHKRRLDKKIYVNVQNQDFQVKEKKFKEEKKEKSQSNILKESEVIRKSRKPALKCSTKQKLQLKKKLPSKGLENIINDESYFSFDGSEIAD